MPPKLPSRLRQSHFPPPSPPHTPDPTHIPDAEADIDDDSDTAQDPPSKDISQEETFTLRILPSSSGQDTLPALLGLNTLSLSLPTSSTQQKISQISISSIPTSQIHLLFSSPKIDTGVRSGFWLAVPSGTTEISVQWDQEREELALLPDHGEDEITKQLDTAGEKKFDYAHLLALKAGSRTSSSEIDGAKTQEDDSEEWQKLTEHITPSQLNRILRSLSPSPDGTTRIWGISTLSSLPPTTNTTDDLHSSLEPQESYLHYTPISFTRTFPPNSIGSERTRWARDRSWYLGSLTHDHGAEILLAEFQISFLSAILLGNYPSLAQWKALLALCLTCKDALAYQEYVAFFVGFLNTLGKQVRYHSLETSGGSEKEGDGDSGSIFEIRGEDGDELARLLREFNQGVADPATRTEVKKVYGEVCETVEELGLDWNLTTTGSGSDEKNGDIQQDGMGSKGLSRRILRLREGFGDDELNGAAGGQEDDDESGEFAPVVVDLDGMLEEHVSHSSEDGHDGKMIDDDVELEDDELEDVRY